MAPGISEAHRVKSNFLRPTESLPTSFKVILRYSIQGFFTSLAWQRERNSEGDTEDEEMEEEEVEEDGEEEEEEEVEEKAKEAKSDTLE